MLKSLASGWKSLAPGAKDFQPLANDFNIELGYLYRLPAILFEDDSNEKVSEDPRESLGRPGSRAPHLWLEKDGRRVSMIDVFGRAFVLIAAPQGTAWVRAARSAAGALSGLELDVHVMGSDGLRDPEGRFAAAFGLSDSGAVLVRPDGFVAWRAASLAADPSGVLAAALGALLMKS